jgi:hypothetical protein
MKAFCAPNPVTQDLALHCVDLHNTGYDTYLKIGMVVGVSLASSSSSIGLVHAGLQDSAIPRIHLGCLPSGSRSRENIQVIRFPAGTSSYETIRTTIEFASDYETDPMDEDPSTPYICTTVVRVRL